MSDLYSMVYIASADGKHAFRVDWNDLYNSFKRNFQLNSNYEISFTLTYTEQYKDVFNIAKEKCWVWYDGQWFNIQQREVDSDENGFATLQITCTHTLIDSMKNVRLDKSQPTEDNPEISGGDSSNNDSSDDSSDSQQAGTVIKETDNKQTTSLDACLHNFLDNNDQNIKYELHGNFPQAAVECTGSLYDWLGQNLSLFSAYYIPDNYTLKIYDLDSLKHQTGKQFRYLHNMTNVDLQTDVVDLVNDCEVYGGKMEKDITTASGNGATEPQNGDWTPVIQNAAGLVGEHLSQNDINLILAQINLESSGQEDAKGGDDGLSDGIAKGLLQFKQSTFDYYSRPPYTDIWHGLDQLVALMNVPNWRNQITGHSGWSPQGAPVSKATIQVQTGGNWGWPFPSVGEGSFSSGQLFGVQPGGGFRTNGFHDGLDFGSVDHPGSEVHAIHGGTVTSIAWGGSEIKWYIVITDETGLNVEYQEAFSSRNNFSVAMNQHVNMGDIIGYRDTDHLHIGITRHNIQEAFNHAFLNDGTWLDPLETIKNGGASGGSNEGSTTTTTEVYYLLHFHYQDEDSIKKYHLHRGAPIIQDSIYDMDALKQYVENTVQHKPKAALTINGYSGNSGNLGDVWRLIAPELQLNMDVTLMGIQGNDEYFHPNGDQELSLNNTGLAMKDAINAIWSDIREVNKNISVLDLFSGTGSRREDHFANENNKSGRGNDNR